MFIIYYADMRLVQVNDTDTNGRVGMPRRNASGLSLDTWALDSRASGTSNKARGYPPECPRIHPTPVNAFACPFIALGRPSARISVARWSR
jgi:hypothetical protein